MSQIQVTRDKTIDILRGIAIVLMVMGNLQPVLQSPHPLYEREGYSELFYPPVIGFNLTALGLFLVDLTKNIPLYKYFQVLGECSLFIYILHSVILGWIIFKIWSDISLFLTLSIYIILIVALLGIGLTIRRYKRHHQLSSWLKFLLGS